MKNLVVRTLVALIAAPLIVLLFVKDWHVLPVFLGLLSGAISLELLYFFPNDISGWRRVLIIILAIAASPIFNLFGWQGLLSLYTVACAFISFTELTQEISGTRERLSYSLFVCFYTTLGPVSALAVQEMTPLLAVFVLVLIWSSDTMAYFTGVLLGRHKLSPVISPNKTWEGFAGACTGGLLCAFVFQHFFIHSLMLHQMLILGIALSLVTQLGDLVESKLKREFKVKDSSHLIPGHGGFLDRFDSFLFVFPTAYLILHFIFN